MLPVLIDKQMASEVLTQDEDNNGIKSKNMQNILSIIDNPWKTLRQAIDTYIKNKQQSNTEKDSTTKTLRKE